MARAPIAGNSNVVVSVYVHVTDAINAFNRLRTQANAALNGVGGAGRTTGLQLRELDRIMQYMAAGALVAMVTGFTRLASELQRTSLLLITLEGSVEKAADQMDRMVTLAGKTPFGLHAISDAFVKMKTAGIDPIIDEKGNGPLRNLLDAVAAFGGTEDQLHRASIAIQQMAGKGVISMEELRQQLGEAVPSAMAIMAEKMGMTMAELVYQITKGNVDAQTGLKALLDGFGEKYGELGEKIKKISLTGAFNGLKNEIDQFAVALDRMGVLDVVTAALRLFTEEIHKVNAALRGEGGDFAASIQAVSTALENFSTWVEKNSDQVASFINVLMAFADILWTISGVIVDLLLSLPPEAAAGGIIGFVLFGGATGFIIGAALGMVAEQLAGFVEFVAAAIKAIPPDVVKFGLIGFMLFGPRGALIGAVVGIITSMQKVITKFLDFVVSRVMTVALTVGNMAAAAANGSLFANPGAAVAASWDKAKGSVVGYFKTLDDGKNKNAQYAKEIMGLGGAGKDDTRVDAGALSDAAGRFRQQLQEMKKAREELASAQKKLETPQGMNLAQLKQYQDAMENLVKLEDKLTKAKLGPGAALRQEQARELEKLDKIKKGLEADAQALSAKGDKRGAADKIKAAAEVGSAYERLRTTVDQLAKAEDARVGARASNKASRAAAKLARDLEREKDKITSFISEIDKFSERLDAAEAEIFGKPETEQARTRTIAQFSTFKDQLVDMTTSVGNLNLHEEDRKKLLESILSLQTRLNVATDEAIRLAELKVKWEKEDAQIQRNRTLDDMERDLRTKNSTGRFDPSMGRNEERSSVLDDWNQKIEGIQDQIREAYRFLEENRNTEQRAQIEGQIENLEILISKYDEYYSYRMSKEYELNQAAQELYTTTGNTIKKSLEDALVALATGTGSVKDIVLQMYAEITAAAARYIVKLLIIKMLEMAGNMFFPGAGSFAANTMSAAQFAIANGAMFSNGNISKFAKGGAFTNSVVSGPTLFNMGLMGEAGEEAVMPLTRIGGKLGVHASGMGGKGGDIYNVEIKALDARSVRDLLLEHGDAMIPAIVGQGRLNNGVGRGK